MAEKKLYLMMRGRCQLNVLREFNELWGRESLPLWIKHGARHIGSFSNFVGDPDNEFIRLWEFDNVSQWSQWQDFLADSEEGKNLVKKLTPYIMYGERKLLHSIY